MSGKTQERLGTSTKKRLAVFACSSCWYKGHLNEMAKTSTENTLSKTESLPVESRDLLLPPLEELVQGTSFVVSLSSSKSDVITSLDIGRFVFIR